MVAQARARSACAFSGPTVCSQAHSDTVAAWSQPGGKRSNRCVTVAAAEATVLPTAAETDDTPGVSRLAADAIQYALNLARVSERYEVHTWMLVLGLLKQRESYACQVLQELGLEDLEGAWNEVLWALHVCDGLKPRPAQGEISFVDRAYKVIMASMKFAKWRGADKVESQDLLMALAAGQVLENLFPDLGLTFDKVQKAVEKKTGQVYNLPNRTAQAAQEDKLATPDDEPAVF